MDISTQKSILKWIEVIVRAFHRDGNPVFMKDSLVPIMGESNMVREFPWASEARE